MPNTVNRSRKRCCIEFICCFLLLLFFIPIRIKKIDNDEERFQKYIAAFNKTYNSSEYNRRLEAFKYTLTNLKLLNSNTTNGTAEYGFTKFSDMLPEEFLKSNLLPDLPGQLQRILLPDNFNFDLVDKYNVDEIRRVTKNIPQEVDWRQENVVTKVRSQKSCSACWAFAAIGSIESVNAIHSGKLESLSIQQIIDCAPFDGCDGGNVCGLMRWMKNNKIKLHTERDYPLTLVNGECRNVTSEGVQIQNYACKDFVGSEQQILYSLATNGPVAVAINALSWQNYIGGIIQFHCDGNPSKLNHAVEIVGYNLVAEVPYYIVRNSWGEDFGDNGYLYIVIGKNMCGLAHEVTIVHL